MLTAALLVLACFLFALAQGGQSAEPQRGARRPDRHLFGWATPTLEEECTRDERRGKLVARELGEERRMAVREGWRGRFFEDFEVGDVYEHPLGRTVTTTDNAWFTLLTQNTAPVLFCFHKHQDGLRTLHQPPASRLGGRPHAIRFGQFGPQFVEGYEIVGGHFLISRPLAVHLEQLIGPQLHFPVGVASQAFAF